MPEVSVANDGDISQRGRGANFGSPATLTQLDAPTPVPPRWRDNVRVGARGGPRSAALDMDAAASA